MAPARYYSDGKLDWRKVALDFKGSPFITMSDNPAKPGERLIHNVSTHSPTGIHVFSPLICTSTLGTHAPDPFVAHGLRSAYNWDSGGYSL